MRIRKIGVLAFHGDVEEHLRALKKASENLKLNTDINTVRTKVDLLGLNGLIIPGGESTTLQKLCEREGMFGEIKKIKNIFGTCAGAILLAKTVRNKKKDQKTLELMDIETDRNAYGKQRDSFEEKIATCMGDMTAVFIRAPRILSAGKGVVTLASKKNEILA